MAAPPPLGPPLANPSTTGQISVGVIVDIVGNRTLSILDDINQQLEADGQSVSVSLTGLNFWNPLRLFTDRVNQPNNYFIRIPFIIAVHVSIPYVSDRTIHMPIDVDVTCDGWQMAAGGTVKATGVAGPSSIEGGTPIEEILSIKDRVDSRVRSSFSTPAPFSQAIGTATCVTLGIRAGSTASQSEVIWDVPQPPSPMDSTTPHPTIEVTYNKLKRLTARNLKGGILYQPFEAILLKTYANYAYAEKFLDMIEEQELELNLPPVSFDSRKFDQLVVIGNVMQVNETPDDTAFEAFAKSANFGPGTHTVRIPKWFIMQPQQIPGSGVTKPTRMPVDAYELTYTVRYLNALPYKNPSHVLDGPIFTFEPTGGEIGGVDGGVGGGVIVRGAKYQALQPLQP